VQWEAGGVDGGLLNKNGGGGAVKICSVNGGQHLRKGASPRKKENGRDKGHLRNTQSKRPSRMPKKRKADPFQGVIGMKERKKRDVTTPSKPNEKAPSRVKGGN